MSVQISYKKHFVLSIFLILTVLVIVEGVSRVYELIDPHCDFLQSDAMKDVDVFLGYSMCYDLDNMEYLDDKILKNKPNQHFQTININSYGFRGPEIIQEKPDDLYRIFMVGGSTTFGAGATSDETTIPGFLQAKFHNLQLDTKIEVINAGIAGAASAQEKYYIETELLSFEPDLFIIYDGVNEIGEEFFKESYDADGNFQGFVESSTTDDKPDQFRFKNISYYRTPFVVYDIFFNTGTDLPATKFSEESVLLFKQRWTEICKSGNQLGFSTIIIVQPTLGSSTKLLSPTEEIRANEKDFLSGRLQTLDGMVESLNELDRYCTKTIDLTNVFDNVIEPIYVDGSHLTDFGNEIVAEEIFAQISPNVLEKTRIIHE